MKKKRRAAEGRAADEEISPALARELRRRAADARNPVRYAVFSDMIGDGRWRLWLDVSNDGYGMSLDQATLFKRKRVARAMAKLHSEGMRRVLLIAKLTTKGGKRRVLWYERPKRRAKRSGVILRSKRREKRSGIGP